MGEFAEIEKLDTDVNNLSPSSGTFLESPHDSDLDDLPETAAPTQAVIPVDPGDDGPPPNGGLKAWLQVLGSFFLFFNSWYVFRCQHSISPSRNPTVVLSSVLLILKRTNIHTDCRVMQGHCQYIRRVPDILRDRPPSQ